MRAMEDAQDLNGVADQTVGYDIRRSRDYELTCARNSTRSTHFGAIGKERLDAADDMERDSLRGRQIV